MDGWMNLDIKKVGQFLAKSTDYALWRRGADVGADVKSSALQGWGNSNM